MDEFLRNIKSNLNTHSENVVVMGNESCDLDSAVSALVYGYFLHWIAHKDIFSNSKLFSNSKAIIPVLNVKRIDLPIKTEVVYFLLKYQIHTENIICRDELDMESILSNDGSKLILVDHHILSEFDTRLFKFVKNIFDHRPKDLSTWKYDGSVISNIHEVGSCATLICSEIHNVKENFDFFEKNIDSAALLYGTIILDTINLNPKADKARPLDFEMINLLESILNISNPENHRKKIFDELLRARTDYSQLTLNQLLKRDLKVVGNIPISGLPMLVKEYFDLHGSFDAIEAFYAENDFSVVMLMGLKVENDVVHRDLAIYSKNNTKEMIIESLVNASTPNLGLIQKNCQHENCKYFYQSNTKASRKQIIPILKSLIK